MTVAQCFLESGHWRLLWDIQAGRLETGRSELNHTLPVTSHCVDLKDYDDCSFTTGFTFDLSGGRATY